MTALEKLLAGVRLADNTIKEILAPVEMTRDNELRELEEALVFAAPTLARIVERMREGLACECSIIDYQKTKLNVRECKNCVILEDANKIAAGEL